MITSFVEHVLFKKLFYFCRLTRLDVASIERSENLRTEVREISRKLNSIEWYSAKYEATLEDIRAVVDQLRGGTFTVYNCVNPVGTYYFLNSLKITSSTVDAQFCNSTAVIIARR